MPSHLVVEVHGNTSEVVELDENDAILIGRDPDLHRLPPADRAARTKTFIQPSVSANHLLARRAGGAIELLDTDSRNGTWLRLPPGDCVQVHSKKALRVQLSAPPTVPETQDGPADANDAVAVPRIVFRVSHHHDGCTLLVQISRHLHYLAPVV